MTRAPYFDNVFISPRTRNEIVKDLTDEKVFYGSRLPAESTADQR